MTAIDPYRDPHECECVICGGHRCACSYPPVCDGCRWEWDFEIEANRLMKLLAEEERCQNQSGS